MHWPHSAATPKHPRGALGGRCALARHIPLSLGRIHRENPVPSYTDGTPADCWLFAAALAEGALASPNPQGLALACPVFLSLSRSAHIRSPSVLGDRARSALVTRLTPQRDSRSLLWLQPRWVPGSRSPACCAFASRAPDSGWSSPALCDVNPHITRRSPASYSCPIGLPWSVSIMYAVAPRPVSNQITSFSRHSHVPTQ